MSKSSQIVLAAVLSCALTPTAAWSARGTVRPAVTAPLTATKATTTSTPVNLLSGATWLYSTDEGKTFVDQPPTAAPKQKVHVIAKVSFHLSEPLPYAFELTPSAATPAVTFELNGKPVAGPLEGMVYRTILSTAKTFKAGSNLLTADLTYENVTPAKAEPKTVTLDLNASLVAVSAQELLIDVGPILGPCGDNFITISCRTNLPASMTGALVTNGHSNPTLSSSTPNKLYHRLRIEGADLDKGAVVNLTLVGQDATLKTSVTVPARSAAGKLRIVAMGDSRTNAQEWGVVAAAAAKQKPDLVIHSGDLVVDGRNDKLWGNDFYSPAKGLLSSVPFYVVYGNHEHDAAILDNLFFTPSRDGKSHNWSQTIGAVQLIGIDGGQDWSTDSDNCQWLRKTLSQSSAKFIFVASHYPAWTSGTHGKLNKAGQPEKSILQARENVLPLLEEFHATAYICGHDHCYERSEMPSGLTHIIAGGAGAPLYAKVPDAAKQNPYSKLYAQKYHYCLIEIDGDQATMKALTPEGELIDQTQWKARKANAQ